MINYRKILRSRKLRLKIIEMLAWVPDSVMLPIQYWVQLGRWPNLKKPRRYTEKMQCYKMRYHNPIMIPCVDKYDVREFVKSRGLEHILNEVYGVYERPNEVDFGCLPNQFVCKDTLGSGSNTVVVCKDKNELDITSLKEQMNVWVSKNVHIKSGGREWPYYEGKDSRILIEKLLSTSDPKGLKDYKFFCFNGRVHFLYLSQGLDQIDTASISFVDLNWNQLPFRRLDFPPFAQLPKRPDNFEEMVKIAETLSEGFPHVRVDLYDIDDNQIVFGEMTFYNSSGYMRLSPDEYDFKIGDMFDISSFM